MNAGQFHTSIRDSSNLFHRLGLLYSPRLYTSLKPDEEFRKKAHRIDVSYKELYVTGLKNLSYNFLLNDFSYLQFYHAEEDRDAKLRYAYYPNPFSFISYDEISNSMADYEDYLQMLEEADDLNRTPPIRYDLAYKDYKNLLHPTSHLHLGLHEDNRWAIDRVLTPLAFSFLIAKSFYLEEWITFNNNNLTTTGMTVMDTDFCSAKSACEELGIINFSEQERRQFHLT